VFRLTASWRKLADNLHNYWQQQDIAFQAPRPPVLEDAATATSTIASSARTSRGRQGQVTAYFSFFHGPVSGWRPATVSSLPGE